MNKNINNSLRIGIIAAAGAAAMISCTDTWNDHYNTPASIVFDGTTMKAIETEAPDFAAVIKAVGYDRELNSENVYTVWAPKSFNKDSVLALAKTDSADVVDKFIKNHIARYAVSADGTEQDITLMSSKKAVMNASSFGTSSLVSGKTNMSCTNGVLHVIDNNINYQNNIFEFIEHQYKTSTDADKAQMGGSLYSFLKVYNADSLDENRSVSRGVDENGDKIWVDSVVIRNNTALKNIDALVYEEDSSYMALIPSNSAYKERYEAYKKLLKFNPSEDKKQEGACDSLQNYYANMFAMTDLFYNVNANEHMEDSLKSTTYVSDGPLYGVYYRKDKKNQPADRPTNDILAGLTPVDCSNGSAYAIDEYPMSITEQSFKKINVMASSMNIAVNTNEKGVALYTKNTGSMSMGSGTIYDYGTKEVTIQDEEGNDSIITVTDSSKYLGTRSYRFLDIPASSSSSMPTFAFYVPNTLSGTYEIYLVTSPIWAKTGFSNGECYENDPRGYRFYAYAWERQSEGDKAGEYPTNATYQFLNPVDGTKYFTTDAVNKIDTLYIGDYTFSNTYYGRGTTEDLSGVMLQISVQISSRQTSQYSREMLVSHFILRPKVESEEAAAEAKRRK